MLKLNTTLFLLALCTAPDMQGFLNKLLLCQTLLLGVDQMHLVVSLGAVFPIGAVF